MVELVVVEVSWVVERRRRFGIRNVLLVVVEGEMNARRVAEEEVVFEEARIRAIRSITGFVRRRRGLRVPNASSTPSSCFGIPSSPVARLSSSSFEDEEGDSGTGGRAFGSSRREDRDSRMSARFDGFLVRCTRRIAGGGRFSSFVEVSRGRLRFEGGGIEGGSWESGI